MKICFISDTHMVPLKNIIGNQEFDLLIHSGDWTFNGTEKEVKATEQYILDIRDQCKDIVWIAGNHDFNAHYWAPEVAKRTKTIYLHDDSVEVQGLKIWGSPWTPQFGRWAYMANRGNDIRKYWESIPENLDILVTHGPPYDILDYSILSHEHCGCWDLLDIVKKRKPKIHQFGHIHYNGGSIEDKFDTKFINAAVCDESYGAENNLIILDI